MHKDVRLHASQEAKGEWEEADGRQPAKREPTSSFGLASKLYYEYIRPKDLPTDRPNREKMTRPATA